MTKNRYLKVRMDPENMSRLAAKASRMGLSNSELARRMIEECLNQIEDSFWSLSERMTVEMEEIKKVLYRQQKVLSEELLERLLFGVVFVETVAAHQMDPGRFVAEEDGAKAAFLETFEKRASEVAGRLIEGKKP